MKKRGPYSMQYHNGNVTLIDPPQRSNVWAKPLERSNGEVYSSPTPVKFYPFDDKYMELLRRGDRDTQKHFVEYFGKLLRIMLRSRKLPLHMISDLQQETFLRVLVSVRTGDVRQPERLGAYVISVCKNILSEHYRQLAREQYMDLDKADVPDAAADLEARIIADENSRRVRATIDRLSERDRVVLQAMMQGRDKDELCHELNVTRDYLRVLTHRAAENFRAQY